MTTCRRVEVVVVGAGPAGTAAAARLAERGREVLLLERRAFPRPKPCGECLNPGAVGELEEQGLLEAVLGLSPARLRGWRLGDAEGNGVSTSFPPGVHGLGVPRAALDHALAREAVARGARMEEGTRVREVEAGGPGRPALLTVQGRDGTRVLEAEMVVGADGLRSTLARRLGTLRRPPRLRKLSLTCRLEGIGPGPDGGVLHLGDHLTVGVAPVHEGGGHWNGTVVVSPDREGAAVARHPAGFFLERLALVPLPWSDGPRIVEGPWASGPFDWPARVAGRGRVFLAGDAAGYYDPLTGQGIFRALRSGRLAAGAVDAALQDPLDLPEILQEYQRRIHAAFAPGRRVQRLVESILSRGRIRRFALRRLSAHPRWADALIGVTGDLAPSRSLLRPGPRFGRPPALTPQESR